RLAEVVFARVETGVVRLDIGAWDGARYEIVHFDNGGAAEQLDDLFARDYNSANGLEVVTVQSSGDDRQGLSIWGVSGNGFARQRARGGCWSRSHTYGISGADIEPGRITATCDGSPQPVQRWPSDVYEWRRGGWTHTTTEQPRTPG
ncbi:MAG: hypothetical protein ACRDU8_03865, partial [Egibacteraceae bacterium]